MAGMAQNMMGLQTGLFQQSMASVGQNQTNLPSPGIRQGSRKGDRDRGGRDRPDRDDRRDRRNPGRSDRGDRSRSDKSSCISYPGIILFIMIISDIEFEAVFCNNKFNRKIQLN